VGILGAVAGGASRTRSYGLRECDGLCLGGVIEPPSSNEKISAYQRIQEDLEGSRDTRIDVNQTVDGMFLGILKGDDAWGIQECPTLDAKSVHYESFRTDVLSNLEGGVRRGRCH